MQTLIIFREMIKVANFTDVGSLGFWYLKSRIDEQKSHFNVIAVKEK